MNRSLKILACSVAFLVILSCGQRNEKDQAGSAPGPTLPLTASEQLLGEWSGIYRGIDGGKPVGEPAEINLIFDANGTLMMVLKDSSAARLEGHWQEFQGRSLIISVTASTMPRVGTTGKLIETPYELLGTSLLIGNSFFEIKASKRTTSDHAIPGQTETGLFGQWICASSNDRKTIVSLAAPADFTLSSSKPGERLFVAKGTIAADEESGLRLVPTSVSDPIEEGAYFKLSGGDTKAQLMYSMGNRGSISLGNCHR